MGIALLQDLEDVPMRPQVLYVLVPEVLYRYFVIPAVETRHFLNDRIFQAIPVTQ